VKSVSVANRAISADLITYAAIYRAKIRARRMQERGCKNIGDQAKI
jgi:hypothetical protein